MNTRLIVLAITLTVLAGLVPGAAAQSGPSPTIFAFTSDRAQVTVAEVESGDLVTTLAWHIAHVTERHRIALHTYQGNAWVPLATESPLPPVGSREVPITSPQNFGPPTYRISVLDTYGTVLDERTLVIAYDPDDLAALEPAITSFTTVTQSVNAAALTYGTARIEAAWEVRDRPPDTNLVFEQLLEGEHAQNIELPRPHLWVPSSGSGVVAPIEPPGGGEVRLRLRLVHVITAETLDEAAITLPVIGTALPPAHRETPPPDSAETLLMAGDLVIHSDCNAVLESLPPRDWVDGPGIPSPNTRMYAYSTNPTGDAHLIIAQADGSGQIVIDAPDKALPIGVRPRWSPDSQRIAFANVDPATPGGGIIYAVNADGTDLRRIATYKGSIDDLAWSRDGTRLFFTSGEVQGSGPDLTVRNYRVYVIVADGLSQPELVAEGCGILP